MKLACNNKSYFSHSVAAEGLYLMFIYCLIANMHKSLDDSMYNAYTLRTLCEYIMYLCLNMGLWSFVLEEMDKNITEYEIFNRNTQAVETIRPTVRLRIS